MNFWVVCLEIQTNVIKVVPLQHTATHSNNLQQSATRSKTLQHAATHCNTPEVLGCVSQDLGKCILGVAVATHCFICNNLQHTATRSNTLQHTATHCNTPELLECVTREMSEWNLSA